MRTSSRSRTPHQRLVRRLRLREDAQAGIATLNAAIFMPIFLILSFAAIQGALIFHARNVMAGAAQQGLQAARGQHSGAGQGDAAAANFIAQAGPRVFTGSPSISISRANTTTRVTISAHPASIIPLIDVPTQTVSVEGATEEITR